MGSSLLRGSLPRGAGSWKPDPYALVHIKEDIQDRLGVPVDIIRVRPKMNQQLKQRIERDAIYV